jgi:hypothetical protein
MGPIKVQSRIAQVTTRNSSVLPPSPKTPFASATELIRNPISPRDTMALPSIAAGYRDFGLGRVDLFRVVFAVGLLSCVDNSLPGVSRLGSTAGDWCSKLLLRRIIVSCGRCIVVESA